MRPTFYSPKIPIGQGDAILGLEISELANVIHYLKPRGEVWVSSGSIPSHSTSLAPDSYPSRAEIEALVRLRTPHLHVIPADRLARDIGWTQTVNMVMLGAFSRMHSILSKESIELALKAISKQFAPINLEAFERGYAFSQKERSVG